MQINISDILTALMPDKPQGESTDNALIKNDIFSMEPQEDLPAALPFQTKPAEDDPKGESENIPSESAEIPFPFGNIETVVKNNPENFTQIPTANPPGQAALTPAQPRIEMPVSGIAADAGAPDSPHIPASVTPANIKNIFDTAGKPAQATDPVLEKVTDTPRITKSRGEPDVQRKPVDVKTSPEILPKDAPQTGKPEPLNGIFENRPGHTPESLSPPPEPSNRHTVSPPTAPRHIIADVRPNNLVQHVSSMIGQRSEGRFEIRLDPPELGRVVISISHTDTGINAHVVADKADVVDFLKRHADIFSRELGRGDLGNASLDFSQNRQPQNAPPEHEFTFLEQADPVPPQNRAGALRQDSSKLDIRL